MTSKVGRFYLLDCSVVLLFYSEFGYSACFAMECVLNIRVPGCLEVNQKNRGSPRGNKNALRLKAFVIGGNGGDGGNSGSAVSGGNGGNGSTGPNIGDGGDGGYGDNGGG